MALPQSLPPIKQMRRTRPTFHLWVSIHLFLIVVDRREVHKKNL